MKLFSALAFSLLMIFAISCKKDEAKPYSCAACVRTPEALAANDASTKGIYKGIVVGSSGTIKFNIANDGTSITAVMILDGITVNLSSSITWSANQPYVAPFTGTMNGQPVSITFSVGLSGANPTVTSSTIPGHPNAVISVIKETSTSMVEAYEGTFTGTEAGTLNIILSRQAGAWFGKGKANTSSNAASFSGTISNGVLTGSASGQGLIKANLGTDVITGGTWNDGSGGSGNWSAQRTL